ncbi:MAG: TolC family protein [Deltaproteobacteria bacterium]|nr:TolC family protein [Deltaproteobacteria bacterium]
MVKKYLLAAFFITPFVFSHYGCKTASEYYKESDRAAVDIIQKSREQAIGDNEGFSIERPVDTLRRRLLTGQGLPAAGDASFGTDMLKPVPHWPETDYPRKQGQSDDGLNTEAGRVLKMGLFQALQAGAMNSPDFQSKKEEIFKKALDLDLKRNDFDLQPGGTIESRYTLDKSDTARSGPAGGDSVEGFEHSARLNLGKRLYNGIKISTALALDLVKLLTQGKTSSMGIVGDASITIPLLRGSGRHIVMEPLTQAQRDVIYAIYDFERYKKTLAVEIASSYLRVLSQLDQVDNTAENYRNLVISARRTRRLADAGRATEIEVDRALQDQLRAKERWISAVAVYENRLDNFKRLMGIPPDAHIHLDRNEMEDLAVYVSRIPAEQDHDQSLTGDKEGMDAGDAPELREMDRENAGPMELGEARAVSLGLDNRLDLCVSEGKVYDAQRAVVIKADALGAELTLFGEANLGESRSLSQAGLADARIMTDRGIYTGLFKLDLPFERTAERNAYRKSFIELESAVRDFQKIEDEIKLSIRSSLRKMSEAREAIAIQRNALSVAEKRVKSTEMFFEAGRAELRDLLDAAEALLTAKNALTSAIVDYRIAELEFQRDTGILRIDKNGLLIEYTPGKDDNGG